MSLLNAVMPLIATLSSAQAAPPAMVAPQTEQGLIPTLAPDPKPALPDNYVVPQSRIPLSPEASYELDMKLQPQMRPNVTDPRTPQVPLALAPPWRDALSHDRTLTKKAIAGQISKAYASNPNYLNGVLDGEKQIPFIRQKDYPLRDTIVQFAKDNNKDPRVFLSQVLHETKNFNNYSSFNPGGIKPSAATTEFINLQPEDSRDQVARQLTQVHSTRETITSDVNKLQNYFSHPDSKFETPKKERDIRQLTNEQLDGLNKKLDYARKTQDWQSLANEVDRLTKVFPKSGTKNNFFWVTQPFMKYENTQDGLRDMQRARGMLPGEKDLSTWGIDAAGNINRLDGNGKPMGSYKGTK